MTKAQKLIGIPALVAVIFAGGAVGGYASLASAQSADGSVTVSSPNGVQRPWIKMHGSWRNHGITGQVIAVNGSTITVAGNDGLSYTIDASTALIQEVVPATISDIMVGESIGVMGGVNGSNIKAVRIIDGVPQPLKN